MAAKKYLSLEEAAATLGVSTKDLIGLRERGEIRGFADRGTWKFKSEDVEEYGRRRQADSNPDVPMLSDDDGLGEEPTVIRRSALDDDDEDDRRVRRASDSDVRLIVDPSLSGSLAGGRDNLSDSDSDVRLLGDTAGRRKSSDKGATPPADLESDVRFPPNIPGRRKGSDSDVKIVSSLADSDSDVRIEDSPARKGSDSDVLLVGPGGKKPKNTQESDSDVKLLSPKPKGVHDTEADMGVLSLPQSGGSDSVLGDDDLVLGDESGLTLKAASGISLERLIDSGISLESGDSGIALVGDDPDDHALGGSGILLTGDSGIALASDGPRGGSASKPAPSKPTPAKPPESDARSTRAMPRPKAPSAPVPDSSLTLADDSGLALEGTDDGIVLDDESGIGLVTAGDSGISLESPIDSGISLESDDDLNRTMPMVALGDDLDGTNVEVPLLSDDDASNYELKMPTGDSGDDVADTSVILFDDDEGESESATQIRRPSRRDDDEPETFDLQDAGDEIVDEDASDLEVSDDIIGEDDELDELDVFDAADEDFDESFVTGESHAEFVAPTRAAAYEAPPAEWGGATFAGLVLSTGLLAMCGMVMFDLVRSMWSWNEPSGVTKVLLEQLKTLFG